VDFYCAEVRLCLEVDGGGHHEKEQKEYDAYRTNCLRNLGFRVLRFTNEDVRFRIHDVVEEIGTEIETLHPHL
jgi:very-short-patch-repair endonuclease